jgi:hypothetical protein
MGEKKTQRSKTIPTVGQRFPAHAEREILFNRVREIYYKKERNLFPFHVNYTP